MKWLLHCIPSDPIADLSDNDGSTFARRPVRSTSTVGKRREKGACQTSHKRGMYLIVFVVIQTLILLLSYLHDT